MTENTRAKKKATSKVKKKESWTISELQMWFRTAIDLQGDDWYPDEEVWGKIVDMVFKLKADEVVRAPKPQQNNHAVIQPNPNTYDPNNQHNRVMSPTEHLIIGHNVQTDGLSLIPPSKDPLPAGIENIDELRRQSAAGTINGGNVIKSGKLGGYE